MPDNLPLPYDPAFAAWQQPTITFLGSFEHGPDALVGPTLGADFWDSLIDPIYGRPMWFDRQGNPISMLRWGELREVGVDAEGRYSESSYVRVGEDDVGEAHVSTVWLGMDHGFNFDGDPDYRPVIFETMIFGGEHDEAMMRYCTEEEAHRGHIEAVTDLRAGMRPWWAYGGQEDDAWHSAGHEEEGQ
jgi:hypothetical protein